MKKYILSLLAMAAVMSMTSCEDDTEMTMNCSRCEFQNSMMNDTIEFCDNEDGTVTATFEDGSTDEQDLNGATFEQFIASQEASGQASCN